MKGSIMSRRFSPSQHFFAQVPAVDVPRASFDRSHGLKTTFNAGWLVPILVDEALPGDTFNLQLHAFARLATPIKPLMDNLYLDTFFFAVPMRLLWANWERFNGAQDNPGDSTSYLIPQMVSPVGGYVPPADIDGATTTAQRNAALSDYLGIPINVGGLSHSSLWHRAYNLIWNDWFRDENLQNSLTVNSGDGPDTTTSYVLQRRGKRHDYFTSCLPWPQKGSVVSLPLGVSAPITATGAINWQDVSGARTSDMTYQTATAGRFTMGTGTLTAGDQLKYLSGLSADLTAATAATINQIRQAFQLQRLYERDARGGTRYTEIVHSHFGVVSPDARLQRPEYLGGGSTFVNFTPVVQSSSAASQPTPQGNVGGMATAAVSGHGFVKSFTEHCVLLGLVNVRADMTYQQGLNRMFSRRTRFDFYWPALSHIGEQAVLNKEIYSQGTADDDLVFGYQERYAEYRYKPSQITGKFRSTSATPLDIWHLAQKFTALPVLNSTFIVEQPPVARALAVPSEPHFLFDAFIKLKCARPMPVYSVPGQMDHF